MDASHVFDPVSDFRLDPSAAASPSTAPLRLASLASPPPGAGSHSPYGSPFSFSQERCGPSNLITAVSGIAGPSRSIARPFTNVPSVSAALDADRRAHLAMLAVEAFAKSGMGNSLWFTALQSTMPDGFTGALIRLCCDVWRERSLSQPLL